MKPVAYIALFAGSVLAQVNGGGVTPGAITATSPIVASGTSVSCPTCSTTTGNGTGYSKVSTAAVTAVAATDTQLVEFSLAAGLLNTADKVVRVTASGNWTTGAGQTPTQNFKIKLCTVSGCGSGTALTLLTWTSAASTASTTQTWIIDGNIGTVATGATGTVISHGIADLPVGSSANTAFAGFHDANTAASSTIDLTAALFLDITFNTSTQSGSLNSTKYQLAKIIP